MLHRVSESPGTLLQKLIHVIYNAVFHFSLVSEFMPVINVPTDV